MGNASSSQSEPEHLDQQSASEGASVGGNGTNSNSNSNGNRNKTNEQTAKFWDSVAKPYAEKPVGNPEAYNKKVDELKKIVKPDDEVLEIGCGTGSLAIELAPHVAHIHAVDISSDMIAIARQKASDAGIENITFYDEPVEKIEDFEPGQFDVVTAFNIRHLVPDRHATLNSLSSLLKPGGAFVSTTACLGELWYVPFGIILPIVRWFGKAPPQIAIMKASELQDDMRAAGFTDVKRLQVGNGAMAAFILAEREGGARKEEVE